jgi:hypothetical protein
MEQLKQIESLHGLKPGLVKQANETTDKISMPSDNKGPLQGLRTVATSSVCVEEIENWLRYQAGRSASGWRPNQADGVITGMLAAANKAKAVGVPEMDAVRLFVGYLVRAVLAKKGAQ